MERDFVVIPWPDVPSMPDGMGPQVNDDYKSVGSAKPSLSWPGAMSPKIAPAAVGPVGQHITGSSTSMPSSSLHMAPGSMQAAPPHTSAQAARRRSRQAPRAALPLDEDAVFPGHGKGGEVDLTTKP